MVENLPGKAGMDAGGALAAPETREKSPKAGAEPLTMTPEEFTRFVRAEMESAANIVNEAGIKPQQ